MASPRRHEKTVVQRCIIHGEEELVEAEYHNNEYPYLAESRLQSYVCQSFLGKEGAFAAYRQAFLQKFNRYMKPCMSI
jgi:hypothetical protein